ncbi:MAG: MFS transporter [Streptococcaceae bacterium]|jgi:DHA3 family macrolide efflux protein-like MFS transporter|nr:MFS transporter [Streptococcaceae bacterium]
MTSTRVNWQRNFYVFLSGQFLSGVTSMIVQYAIIWYLTERTGSATILSFSTLFGMIPMVVLSPFVGPLIDRFNKKGLLIITDLVVALFALILTAVGTLSTDFPIWLVFVSLLIRSISQTFQMPTIQSILPTIVPDKELTRANGQLSMVQSANFIIAPALGAFLFSLVPINLLILLDVLGAILGISLLFCVFIPQAKNTEETIHLFRDTKIGFELLRKNKGLWQITILESIFLLVFMPAASMYPLMTMSYFHRSVGDAGMIEVVYASGMLLGGIFIGLFGKWRDRMKPVIAADLIIALALVLSGVLPANDRGFWLFLVLNAIAGVATPYFNSLFMAMIQQSYEVQYLGRVLGVLNAMISAAGPIGLLFSGPLVDKIGVEKLFLLAGSGALICGVITLMLPEARRYDKNLQKRLADNKNDN